MAASLAPYMKSMLRNVQNPCRRFSQISYNDQTPVFNTILKQNVIKCSDKSLPKYKKTYLFTSPSMQIRSFIPPQISKSGDEPEIDAEKLVREDMLYFYEDIKAELISHRPELKQIAEYYFDGKGKALRPLVVILMARCLNTHINGSLSTLLPKQRQVAMITEMIHNASLIHDDVIDDADARRGKSSINMLWGQRKAVLGGDFIISIATRLLARIDNKEVTSLFAQILADLVHGEFLQLGSKEEENERFSHYLLKTFKKTASLLAHSCQAVAVLSLADKNIQHTAFHYGKNVGIALQLIDDVLDFTSTETTLGKPVVADLRQGLATAPVLFACEKYPELNAMIMRRFSQTGDIEKASEMVLESDGLEQTRFLAHKHLLEAVKHIQQFSFSREQKALIDITSIFLNRVK